MYTFVRYLIKNTNVQIDLTSVYLQLNTLMFKKTIVDNSTI